MNESTAASALLADIEAEARRLGFTLFGVAPPDPTPHMPFYGEWLEAGRHGEMAYLGRDDSVARRADLRRTMDSVRSVIVVGHEYGTDDDPSEADDLERAVIARYARGHDYHDVVKGKLVELLTWLDGRVEGGVRGRPYVDTGPILERDLARRAGLGWFGRNTMLIDPRRGSYFFIGVLLVDVELTPSEPFEADRCGSCRACLDACPTGALLGRDETGAPVIDARRCISYLTIELRGPIPVELREGIGNRVFGCDICQEVCPWNRSFAGAATEPEYLADVGLRDRALASLTEDVLALDDAGFRERFRKSPVLRTKRGGLLRNLCVGLGNALRLEKGPPSDDSVRALRRALADGDPVVRGHAAWALGQSGLPFAADALRAALETEADPWVRSELESSISR